jgi:hypothetical protein
MKRLLILTAVGMLLGSVAGCRFMECLWRGPACQQPAATVAPVTTCPNPCPAYNPCDPCATAPSVTTTPGPVTYAPATGS